MGTVADVLRIAKGEVGYAEGPKNNQNKYASSVGHANRQPWCATYVAWVFKQAGVALPSTSAYTPAMYAGFKNDGKAVDVDNLQPGDVVFFHWPGMGRIAHVGIFSHYGKKGSAWVYEGNTNGAGSRTGGEVLLKNRKKGLITHAGRPDYGQAITTPKEEPMGLTNEDKVWVKDVMGDLFRLVLRGEDRAGKKTGHQNLEDINEKVDDLLDVVEALRAEVAALKAAAPAKVAARKATG